MCRACAQQVEAGACDEAEAAYDANAIYHAVHVPCTCRAHAVHMPCTCRAHAVHMHMHMPCTCTLEQDEQAVRELFEEDEEGRMDGVDGGAEAVRVVIRYEAATITLCIQAYHRPVYPGLPPPCVSRLTIALCI